MAVPSALSCVSSSAVAGGATSAARRARRPRGSVVISSGSSDAAPLHGLEDLPGPVARLAPAREQRVEVVQGAGRERGGSRSSGCPSSAAHDPVLRRFTTPRMGAPPSTTGFVMR